MSNSKSMSLPSYIELYFGAYWLDNTNDLVTQRGPAYIVGSKASSDAGTVAYCLTTNIRLTYSFGKHATCHTYIVYVPCLSGLPIHMESSISGRGYMLV